MLTLPIKKKWFDMILSGEKQEEYREIKPYYDSRFYHIKATPTEKKETDSIAEFNIHIETIKEVIFRNGYSKNSPSIKCKVDITTGEGKEAWGAEPNKKYFILKILSVEVLK